MSFGRLRMLVRLRRLPWLCLSYGGIGLGTAGIFLPLVPTTPFLLVAAWAAPKGSPRLNRWLHRHPRFGPLLHAWRSQRAVPAGAKAVALALLAGSWGTLWSLGSATGVLLFTGLLFIALAGFLLTRPTSMPTPRGSPYE